VVVGENCTSLVEYLRAFDITLSVLQKPYSITRVMYEVCEDAVADGVRYLEVRFSPILHTREGMNLSQVMEAVCEAQVMAEHNLPILCV
jgi:adenosine deaminase